MSDDDGAGGVYVRPEDEIPAHCPDGQDHELHVKVRHGRIAVYCPRCDLVRWTVPAWRPSE